MEGGLEEDLEKLMVDLTRVDNRVTTIVAGVRSMSMTFKVWSNERGARGTPTMTVFDDSSLTNRLSTVKHLVEECYVFS